MSVGKVQTNFLIKYSIEKSCKRTYLQKTILLDIVGAIVRSQFNISKAVQQAMDGFFLIRQISSVGRAVD
jgi:hypothetical protein